MKKRNNEHIFLSIMIVCIYLGTFILPLTNTATTTNAANTQDNDNNSETLIVDGYVLSKLAKPYDKITLYATTSYYSDTMYVFAQVYYLGRMDNPCLFSSNQYSYRSGSCGIGDYYSYLYPDISSLFIMNRELIDIVELKYYNDTGIWQASYTIPQSAQGGVYEVGFVAMDGINGDVDDATVHLLKMYEEYLMPVYIDFLNFYLTDLSDTLNYIRHEIENLTETVNGYGGIDSIVENITNLTEWEILINATSSNNNTKNIGIFITNLTGFILSDEYDNLTTLLSIVYASMLNLSENELLNTLIGFNLSEYLEYIDNTENISTTWKMLAESNEYIDFLNNLTDISSSSNNNILSVYTFMHSILKLLASDTLNEFINNTITYIADNDTYLQRLIQSIILMFINDKWDELNNITLLPEFDVFINAIENQTGLRDLYETVNTTYNNITNKIEEMRNSNTCQELNNSIRNLYMYLSSITGNSTFYSYTIKELIDEMFIVLNTGVLIENAPFYEIGNNATVNITVYDTNGGIPNIDVTVIAMRKKPFVDLYSYASYPVFNLENTLGCSEMYELFSIIQQKANEYLNAMPIEIIYYETLSTDENGKIEITLPVDNFGVFSIYAFVNDSTYFGIGTGAFLGEQYIPEIGLEKTGYIGGIPVYINRNRIGENITFNVSVLENVNSTVGLIPMFTDIMSNLFQNANYNETITKTVYANITSSDTVSMRVYTPISLVYVISGNIVSDEELYSPLLYPYHEINLSFGILLTGDVDVDILYPSTIIKNNITELRYHPTEGNAIATAGFGMYSNAFDYMCVDVSTLSAWIYGNIAKNTSLPDTTEIFETLDSLIFGVLGYGFITIPDSAISGNYSLISVTFTDNNKYGVNFVTLPVVSQTQITDDTPPVITHTPVTITSLKRDIIIDATITDEGIGVRMAKLFYRSIGDENYTVIYMNRVSNDVWYATIPEKSITLDGIEYYIWATDSKNENITDTYTVYIKTEKEEPLIIEDKTYIVDIVYIGRGNISLSAVDESVIARITTSKHIPAGIRHINIFVNITTTGLVNESFITINYTDDDVKDIDEELLRMYFFNESTDMWELIPDSGVWTNNNTVWAKVKHFTIFAPMVTVTKEEPKINVFQYVIYGIASIIVLLITLFVVINVEKHKRKKH